MLSARAIPGGGTEFGVEPEPAVQPHGCVVTGLDDGCPAYRLAVEEEGMSGSSAARPPSQFVPTARTHIVGPPRR